MFLRSELTLIDSIASEFHQELFVSSATSLVSNAWVHARFTYVDGERGVYFHRTIVKALINILGPALVPRVSSTLNSLISIHHVSPIATGIQERIELSGCSNGDSPPLTNRIICGAPRNHGYRTARRPILRSKVLGGRRTPRGTHPSRNAHG